MKKLLALFLCVACLFSVTGMAMAAEQPATPTVEELTALVEAIPDDVSGLTSSENEGFEEAMMAVNAAMDAFALVSDDVIQTVPNYTKVADTTMELMIVAMKGMTAPFVTITDANWQSAMDTAMTIESAFDILFAYGEILAPIGSVVTVTDLYEEDVVEENYGLYLLQDFYMTHYNAFMEVLYAYMEEVSGTDVNYVKVAVYSFEMLVDSLPDSVTVTDVLLYGGNIETAWYLYESMTLAEDMNIVLDEEKVAKLQALKEQCDALVATQEEAILAQVDAQIAQICDLETVLTQSSAARLLTYFEDFMALENQMTNLYVLFGEYTLANQKTYDVYEAALYGRMIWGDTNGDYEVDAKDALAMLKYAVGEHEMSDEMFWNCDVNFDEAVDAKDALATLKYAVGTLDEYPIWPADDEFVENLG